jgi:hypothetical protein
MSFLQLLLNPGKRTLAEVVLKLPNQGVGSRVTRRTWAPFGNSYWEVTRVVPKGEAGKDTEVGRSSSSSDGGSSSSSSSSRSRSDGGSGG